MVKYNFWEERERLDKELQSLIRVSIYAHLDIDGMSSAALLSRILNKYNVNIAKVKPTNYEDFNKKIKDKTDIIILDLDFKPENVRVFSPTSRLIVLDHHNVYSYSFLYLNPKVKYPSAYIPCSAFIFYLYTDVLAEYDWMAAIGTISDSGGQSNSDLINSVINKYHLNVGKDPNYFDTILGKLSESLNYIITIDGRKGSKKVYDMLMQTNSISELINNEELKRYSAEGDKIMNYLRNDFLINSEHYGRLYIYNIAAKYKRFASTLATMLAFEKENSNIVIINKISDDLMRMNLRSSVKDVDLNVLVSYLLNNKLIISGGGHSKAMGISMDPSKYDEVKKAIIKYLS